MYLQRIRRANALARRHTGVPRLYIYYIWLIFYSDVSDYNIVSGNAARQGGQEFSSPFLFAL